MRRKRFRVLIDTNVAITYVTGREDKYSSSSEFVMKQCANSEIMQGYISFHSIPEIWYCTRHFPSEVRREWLMQICTVLTVVSADHDDVLDAIQQREFKDFEDCLQDKCAKKASCDYIVTANLKDYINSEVPAVSPDDMMKLIVSVQMS